MPTVCLALPVLLGKSEVARELGRALMGPRAREVDAAEKRLKISKEAWFLQKTPQGEMLLVYFEATDIQKAFEDFARSQEPFDKWWRDKIKEITGIDMAQPPAGPPPEQILSYGY